MVKVTLSCQIGKIAKYQEDIVSRIRKHEFLMKMNMDGAQIADTKGRNFGNKKEGTQTIPCLQSYLGQTMQLVDDH